ncbi:hypothetical protein X737_39370 [Mesorhizobium sp. L48C026A00]|nr:hypothetical protein X737_39370 [Mesorhizobium sp. L48C026A00]
MLPKQPDFEGNPPGRIGIPAVGVDLHDEVVSALAHVFQATKKEDDSAIVDQTATEMLGSNRSCRRHRRQRRASVVRRRVLSLVHDVLIDSAFEAPSN